MHLNKYLLETVTKKLTQTQKYVHCKKSTILLQIGWYLGTFTYSWASHFDQVSQLQDKNCEFFKMNIFLSLGQIFRDSLYMRDKTFDGVEQEDFLFV